MIKIFLLSLQSVKVVHDAVNTEETLCPYFDTENPV